MDAKTKPRLQRYTVTMLVNCEVLMRERSTAAARRIEAANVARAALREGIAHVARADRKGPGLIWAGNITKRKDPVR